MTQDDWTKHRKQFCLNICRHQANDLQKLSGKPVCTSLLSSWTASNMTEMHAFLLHEISPRRGTRKPPSFPACTEQLSNSNHNPWTKPPHQSYPSMKITEGAQPESHCGMPDLHYLHLQLFKP